MESIKGELIYCVVAHTVQIPLIYEGHRLKRSDLSKTIAQPAGRLIAQAAHAVSLSRLHMVRKAVFAAKLPNSISLWDTLERPITTIILGARDTYELYHVWHLLNKKNIDTYAFQDTNEDYGSDTVVTAVATRVVNHDEVVEILDYLPLWRPQCSV